MLVGERLIVGPVVPVPDRVTTCGLLLALSETLSVAVRVPVAVGAKEMLMVQDPPAATLDPQLLLCLKSPGSAPPPKMLLMVSVVLCPLFKVTCCDGLVVPTA